MQLTINGVRQSQILGKYIRENYIENNKIINNKYNKKEFEMISSPAQRTIFTSGSMLSQIFPEYILKVNYEEQSEIFNNDTIPNEDISKVKEVPLLVINPNKDNLFHATNCNFRTKKLENLIKDENEEFLFKISKEDKLLCVNELQKYLGLENSNSNEINPLQEPDGKLKELSKFFSPYVYHYGNKLKNTNLSKTTLLTLKKYILNRIYDYRVKDSKFSVMTTSRLFDELNTAFTNSINSIKNNQIYKKMIIYVGHDTTLISIVSNLLNKKYLKTIVLQSSEDNSTSSFNFLVPSFASNFIFELHHEDNTNYDLENFSVLIKYNGKIFFKGIEHVNDDDIIEGRIKFKKFNIIMDNLIDDDYKLLDCSNFKKFERKTSKLK